MYRNGYDPLYTTESIQGLSLFMVFRLSIFYFYSLFDIISYVQTLWHGGLHVF